MNTKPKIEMSHNSSFFSGYYKGSSERKRREKRKCNSMSKDDFKKIIKKLKKIDGTSALIAELIWFLNESCGRGGDFVTLEEIRRLKKAEFSPENDHQPCLIKLKRCGLPSVHWLPKSLGKRISKQIHPSADFLFCNKKQRPPCRSMINRHFRKAGQQMGFENITSLSLRPSFNKKGVIIFIIKEDEAYLQAVTTEDFLLLCKQIPLLVPKKGRKHTHHPRDLLNAILYHLREQCPMKKLPFSCPPWTSVKSQKQRWDKNKVIEEVIRVRKEINLQRRNAN